MTIHENMQKKIYEMSRPHNLRLAIIYGSFARGETHTKSDLDIAVLGERKLDFQSILVLSDEYAHIFKGSEVSVQSLHNVDAFFRYQVTRNSILIYGEPSDYHEFRAYAFRAYIDSKDLLNLERILTKKTLQYLRQAYV